MSKMNWENLDDMIEEIAKLKINVQMVNMNKFAYTDGKDILINKNLPRDARIYVLVHEIAHLSIGYGVVEHYSSSHFEDADEKAIEALSKISENESQDFSFKKLMKYSYFHKLKDSLNEKKLI